MTCSKLECKNLFFTSTCCLVITINENNFSYIYSAVDDVVVVFRKNSYISNTNILTKTDIVICELFDISNT